MRVEIEVKLQKIRKSQKLSLIQVAQLSGISPAQLSKIERGKSDPTLTTMVRIAYALKCSCKDIFICKVIDE